MPKQTLPVIDTSNREAKSGDARLVGRLPAYALRVSLLEQCQFHCPYCLPGSVNRSTQKDRWLSATEIGRVVGALRERGLTKVRITGGEPLLRADVVDVVRVMREALPLGDVALTTNGALLDEKLDDLTAAGLHRVTIHLDTLREERYERLMGTGASPRSILDVALRAKDKLADVKLNVVVQRGQNDDEIADFIDLSRTTGLEVRFIELMNTGSARGYVAETFLSGKDIVERVRASTRVRPLDRRHASDPAALYATGDGLVFGVIASDTEPFCGACDRVRLTADGRLRGCLYESGGVPLGALLKSGVDDVQLRAVIDVALDDKRSHHPLISASRVPFSMADVGG
jgi:cyclic pyranopterin phosphate synthase